LHGEMVTVAARAIEMPEAQTRCRSGALEGAVHAQSH
jgi:hypothetical protein